MEDRRESFFGDKVRGTLLLIEKTSVLFVP